MTDVRAPDWTERQFATLYANPSMPAADLGQLVDRSEGAVQAVRGFVCGWHRGGNTSGLSAMMVGYLESHRGGSTCAECGATV